MLGMNSFGMDGWGVLRGPTRLEFWILVICICFGFRVSCFEFIENPISKRFSLSQQVNSLNGNFSISSGNFLKIFIVILAKAGIQCFFEFSGFPFSRE